MNKNIYQLALDSQTACNLSGLIHSLPEIADQVWAEIREGKSTTQSFNKHPVMRLFAEQIQFLAAGEYSEAAQICRERAEEVTS